ncbi:threonine-phosphate decarboxylase CobD [Effusibacillus dendaii]|uniref:threonine-phosphate decarboxylase n=1 Tax=Effusibacillus dendaii TaxID=2743772 RepID=A0A7I8DCD4_9BACL|nr:threonine-phosphate decarboxylase CobD [Effusibacillus dendaii]BCJ86629.1 threonine-phosphate decarboxylase [Effusibacillus dendaii]
MQEVMPHGGNIGRYQKEWGWRREDLIDFSANLNPLGPPESVLQAIKQSLSRIQDYPDPYGWEVLYALSDKWRLPTNRFLLGNGAAELIFLVMRLLRPKRIVTVSPAFREYEQAAKLEGAEIIRVPLLAESDFSVQSETLREALSDADLLVLANPNNPTGRCVEQTVLRQLLEHAARNSIWLMVDEAFLDFLPDDHARSVIADVDLYEKLIVIRSMTKFYAIPGIRIGYLAANEAIIAKLRELQIPWSVNTPAQAAAVAALADQTFADSTFQWLLTERPFLTEGMKRLGFHVVPSETNFLLLSKPGLQITELWPQLAAKGIFVRDCRSFAGLNETYFRIAIRSRQENNRLLQALSDVLG